MPTFCKEERLCNKNIIQQLFLSEDKFFIYPYTVIWKKSDGNGKNIPKILISVTKRNFKKAVDRNKLKRLTREAYRINKEILFSAAKEKNKIIVIMFIYSGKNMLEFKEIEKKMIQVLNQVTAGI